MNKLVANLRHLMRVHIISENQLSRNTGVPQPTIHRILAGRVADPRDGTLRPLATWFGVTVEQLRTDLPDPADAAEGDSPYRIDPSTGMAIRERPRDIAIAEVAISAMVSGSGPEVAVIDTGRCLPFPVTWFEHHPVAAADVRVITVEGDSMERTLFHGDRIAINLRDTRITDGRVHVMVTGGPAPAVKVKRLFTLSNGNVRIVSDNPDKERYPDELLGPAELTNVLVVARVLDRSGPADL